MRVSLAVCFVAVLISGCSKPAQYSMADYDANTKLATEVAVKCSQMAQNQQDASPDCASAKAWLLTDRPSTSNNLPSLDEHEATKRGAQKKPSH